MYLIFRKVESETQTGFGLCPKETSMILMEYTFQKRAKINLVDTITSKVNINPRQINRKNKN